MIVAEGELDVLVVDGKLHSQVDEACAVGKLLGVEVHSEDIGQKLLDVVGKCCIIRPVHRLEVINVIAHGQGKHLRQDYGHQAPRTTVSRHRSGLAEQEAVDVEVHDLALGHPDLTFWEGEARPRGHNRYQAPALTLDESVRLVMVQDQTGRPPGVTRPPVPVHEAGRGLGEHVEHVERVEVRQGQAPEDLVDPFGRGVIARPGFFFPLQLVPTLLMHDEPVVENIRLGPGGRPAMVHVAKPVRHLLVQRRPQNLLVPRRRTPDLCRHTGMVSLLTREDTLQVFRGGPRAGVRKENLRVLDNPNNPRPVASHLHWFQQTPCRSAVPEVQLRVHALDESRVKRLIVTTLENSPDSSHRSVACVRRSCSSSIGVAVQEAMATAMYGGICTADGPPRNCRSRACCMCAGGEWVWSLMDKYRPLCFRRSDHPSCSERDRS